MHIIKRDYKHLLEKPGLSYDCSRPGAGPAPVPLDMRSQVHFGSNLAVPGRGNRRPKCFLTAATGEHHKSVSVAYK